MIRFKCIPVFIMALILSVFSVSLVWSKDKILKQPSYERTRVYDKSYDQIWLALLSSIPKPWNALDIKSVSNDRGLSYVQSDKSAGLISFYLTPDYLRIKEMKMVKILIEPQVGDKTSVSINCPDSSGIVEEYFFSRIERYSGLVKDDFKEELFKGR